MQLCAPYVLGRTTSSTEAPSGPKHARAKSVKRSEKSNKIQKTKESPCGPWPSLPSAVIIIEYGEVWASPGWHGPGLGWQQVARSSNPEHNEGGIMGSPIGPATMIWGSTEVRHWQLPANLWRACGLSASAPVVLQPIEPLRA